MFNNRISGDYDGFITFDLEMVKELIPQTFIETIEQLIEQSTEN